MDSFSNFQEIHLHDYLYVLRKRKFAIILFITAVLTLTVLYTVRSSIVFLSTGTILIERENPNVVDFKEVMALDASSTEYYQTQYQILKSKTLSKQLIERENLIEDAYFKKSLTSKSRFSWLQSLEQWPEKYNIFFSKPSTEDIFINKMLKVKPVRNSRLVNVSIVHPDPTRSMEITNTFLDLFIERNLNERYKISTKASELISEQLVKLKGKVTAAELDLQKYKEKHNLVSIPSIYEQDEFLQEAKLELVKIQAEEAKLSKRYLAAHPRRIHIRSQIEGLSEKIEEEEKKRMGLSRIAVEYSEIEREAVTARKVYEALLTRMEETASEAQTQTSNVMIVDRANFPNKPYRPRPLLNFLIGIAVSFMGGAFLAFFLEYLDSTIKIPEDIERGMGLHLFGIVPRANTGLISKRKLFFLSEKHSAPSESIRALRTALLFKTRHHDGCRSILVTSPNPSEGKSTVVANLAAAFAQNNLKVALLDCDLRKPKLHEFMEASQENGVTNILEENKSFREVIKENVGETGIDFISAGSFSSQPTEILGAKAMQNLIEDVRKEYDVILLDAPPFLPVADVAVLSEYAQTIVCVVRHHKTHRNCLKGLERQFEDFKDKLFGVVINDVGVKGKDRYYHQYYYYGYGNDSKK